MKEELLISHFRPLVLQGETFSIEVPVAQLGKLAEKISKQLNDDRRQVNEAVKIKGRRGTLVVPPQEAKNLLSLINEIKVPPRAALQAR